MLMSLNGYECELHVLWESLTDQSLQGINLDHGRGKTSWFILSMCKSPHIGLQDTFHAKMEVCNECKHLEGLWILEQCYFSELNCLNSAYFLFRCPWEQFCYTCYMPVSPSCLAVLPLSPWSQWACPSLLGVLVHRISYLHYLSLPISCSHAQWWQHTPNWESAQENVSLLKTHLK